MKQLIEGGELGEVLYFDGKIFLQMGEEVGRLYDPEMGGGALLDIGLYMIALSTWVYGSSKPELLQASALLHKNGVDTSGSLNLRSAHYLPSCFSLISLSSSTAAPDVLQKFEFAAPTWLHTICGSLLRADLQSLAHFLALGTFTCCLNAPWLTGIQARA